MYKTTQNASFMPPHRTPRIRDAYNGQAAAAACLGAIARACLNEFDPFVYDSLQTVDRLAMGFHPQVASLRVREAARVWVMV